tara:strand:+ start:421 stop:1134 length:714 start_codon:yes stop_codon:yes gene_type:complete
MSFCFISDLHIDNKREDIKKAFFDFLNTIALNFENLFIIGDLFEVWVGDDYQDQTVLEVIKELKKFSSNGGNIFIMHGNRDFLLGKDFCDKFEGKIIDDPYIFEFGNKKIYVSHGDAFCTDDIEYHNFKKMVRSSEWQKNFLNETLKKRIEIANGLRKDSSSLNKNKDEYLMDVNLSEVESIASEESIDVIIHGHVHRPKVHHEKFGTRYVLGDWDKNFWYLSLKNGEFDLVSKAIK